MLGTSVNKCNFANIKFMHRNGQSHVHIAQDSSLIPLIVKAENLNHLYTHTFFELL